MNEYLRRAANLQSSVQFGELKQDIAYSEEEVSQAVVHTRQDVVLICSYLLDLNKQLAWIRYGVFCLVVLNLVWMFL